MLQTFERFKNWMTGNEVYSSLNRILKSFQGLCSRIEALESKIEQVELAEKSRQDIVESMVCSEETFGTVECGDCITMRLEIDVLRNSIDEMKSRLESIEAVKKPKRTVRKKIDEIKK